MKNKNFILKAKRFLIITLSITVLIMVVMWAFGIRFEHLKTLRLIFCEPMELSAKERTEVYEWLQKNTINLTTIEAGSGFEDMMPLKAMIGDAHIVSLGEHSHLNGSFYKVKHRMVEFLVSEMDFTVFAIEAPFGCTYKINEYLLGEDVSPQEALEELVYKVWRTEEILEMLIWMREYNATHDKKLKFYGLDTRPVFRCAKVVYDYLRRTNGTQDYDDILLEWITLKIDRSDRDKLKNIIGEVRNLISYLESQCPAANQDKKEWEYVVQNSKVLLQYVLRFSTDNRSKRSDIRDEHMADNVKWIIDHEEGTKTILWAANPHITVLPGSGCMGAYLRRMYGDKMLVIALIGGRKGSIEALLAEAGLKISVLDFRSLPKGIVLEYLNSPFRSGGIKTIYPLSYDAVLYIESTSGAHMIETQEFLFRVPEI
ncbi:MAG: erythromycin esterase family protein [Sedimentisphaerales bacterium]|nr:erythromycin esterase family protein [Sedimentisphaerales bacterium]